MCPQGIPAAAHRLLCYSRYPRIKVALEIYETAIRPGLGKQWESDGLVLIFTTLPLLALELC